MKEKTPLSHEAVCFRMLDFETSNSKYKVSKSILENYVTSEGVISHIVVYHQHLPVTHYQVRFYANSYFE